MAVRFNADVINGNVNLATDNTLYVVADFVEILDNNDDGIDVVASGTELVVRGTAGSDAFNGIHIDNFLGPQSDNTIIVASTGIVVGSADGILSTDATSTDVIINYGGLVTGGSDGIVLDGSDNVITNNGKIIGEADEGVEFDGNFNRLENYGEIVGNDNGVEADGDFNEILNSGTIHGGTEGVDVDGNNNRVVNTGQITSLSGFSAAVMFTTEAGEINSLFNSGSILGHNADGVAVITGDGDETISNHGMIDGHVVLGGGNDLFNGTGGTVSGTVFGGAGDDLYIVDDPTLTISEEFDEGHDTVTANSGFTLGDNIEDLNLVGDGDHTGVGNSLANVINGNIGDNTINGGGGDDLLRGNDGDDTLRGSGGDDRLVGGQGDDSASGGAGNDTVLGGAGDDGLRGGVGDDVLRGGPGNDRLAGGGGDDRLFGGGGDDAIVGGAGADVLFGGADADRFVYNSILETPVGAGNRDRIQQFSSAQGDRIDLAGIDADVDTAEDDGFTFIGQSAFSGSAGELRVVDAGANLLVRGDVDGDGNADFEIFVNNTASLSAGDFVL